MAGFLNNPIFSTGKPLSPFGKLSKALKRLSSLGMDYEDMVIKNSKAIGVTEAQLGQSQFMPEDFLYSLAMSDIGQKKFIAYFDKQYTQRRDYLRNFAMNGEIENMVEIIADEAIVYDERNFFCKLDMQNLRRALKDDMQDEIISYAWEAFNRVYYKFHFIEGHDAWSYFKQFLIDGFLAFEIIYDDDVKNIIGFKELDPSSLRPGVQKNPTTGALEKIWVEYEDVPSMRRVLYDSEIIYISYAKGNFTSRTSYVERLIRSFNLLRILENSRIIWNVMNASFRMKMVVPIGSASPQKAKTQLAELISLYKEDISLDMDSGELSCNGKPSPQFYKNYLFPSKNGEAVDIETLEGSGMDIGKEESLKYFYDKLKEDSKIPFTRFEHEQGGGQYSMQAEGMDREEIRFSKFIIRLRSIFQEIILKPVLLQIQLRYPFLQNDEMFKSALGIEFTEENLFKELKMMEIQDRRVQFLSSLQGLTTTEYDQDGQPTDVPLFDGMFLVEKFLKMSQADLEMNQLYINRRKKGLDPRTGKKMVSAAPEGGEEGGEGGGGNEGGGGGGVDLSGL